MYVDASVVRIPPEFFVPLGPGLTTLEFCDVGGRLVEICRRAFHRCVNMTFVPGTNLPSTLEILRDEAFGQCRSLVEARVPGGTTVLLRGTFVGCATLSRCYLPDAMRVIMSDAFGPTRLDGAFVLPPNVCTIGDAAFRDAKCRKMLLPSSITIVGRHLFYGCERMFSLELSNSVTRIKNYACMDCASLRNVVLPPSARRGGLECFHGCLDLLDLFGTGGGRRRRIEHSRYINAMRLSSSRNDDDDDDEGAYD